MSNASIYEQYLLELINRARLDPGGEAARLGIGLNQGLAPSTISAAQKPVLAMNDFLQLAADNHTKWMIANDQYGSQEPANFPTLRTGLTPLNRMTGAGYTFGSPAVWGENLSWKGSLGEPVNSMPTLNLMYKFMFQSASQRANLLNPNFQEVGIGQERGFFLRNGTNYDAGVMTADFARTDNKVFVTGVLFQDLPFEAWVPRVGSGDKLYSLGEGNAGRSVTGTGGVSDTTGAGGGYALEFTPNQGTVTITLNTTVTHYPYQDYHEWESGPATRNYNVVVEVAVDAANIKLDVRDGVHVLTDTSLTGIAGLASITALGSKPVALAGARTLIGNKAANVLTGTESEDTLNGLGGADLMRGGLGFDKYFVDSAGDVVDDTGGLLSERDFVTSSVNFNMSDAAHAKGNLDNLTLTGNAIVGVGNALDNLMKGNAGNNGLNGLAGNDTIYGLNGNDGVAGAAGNDRLDGGWGNDVLTGGAGQDRFEFNAALNASLNRDTIKDFSPADDTIVLDLDIFKKVFPRQSELDPALLRNGTKALDGNDYLIYDRTTGALSYDSDGWGANAAIQFATLSNKPLLTYHDFYVTYI